MEPKSEIYRHIKTGGLYVVLMEAEIEASMEAAVVYKSLKDGRVWVRPASEFYDENRFKHLSRNQVYEVASISDGNDVRYEHHADPAIAFCIETDIIEAIYHDVRIGLTPYEALVPRVERAMQFRVGGDLSAILAKARLREINASLRGHKLFSDVPSRATPSLTEAGKEKTG